MANWVWILLGLALLFWMFKKGGCCGMGKKPMKGGEKEMEENEAKDPVCGMTVKKDEAAATSQAFGKTFYFCAQACKEKFTQNPMQYMGKGEEGGMSGCH